MIYKLIALVALSTVALLSFAGEADVTNVKIQHLGDREFQISTTVAHADTGWDHYANRWDVLDENGDVLGSRELAHPHVDEQPFTRSLRLTIPASVKVITVRANDSVHGLGGKTFTLELPN